MADTIIAAGWRRHDEWLMGSGGTGKNAEVPPADQPLVFEIIGHGEIGRRGQPRWRSIAKGLTFEQANAIVVEHNRQPREGGEGYYERLNREERRVILSRPRLDKELHRMFSAVQAFHDWLQSETRE